PDRNKSEESAAIFTVVQMAYDTLMDAGKRRRYDSTIPALGSTMQTRVKVILEGAYTEGYALDDRASISLLGTDEVIVFENSITIPTIWVHSQAGHKQYSLFTETAFERLFRALYGIVDPKEKLTGLRVAGTPELRAHFD